MIASTTSIKPAASSGAGQGTPVPTEPPVPPAPSQSFITKQHMPTYSNPTPGISPPIMKAAAAGGAGQGTPIPTEPPIPTTSSSQLISSTLNSHDPGDILALGFGTTVAMWAIGYVGHMPFGHLPSSVFLPLILLANLAGGAAAGRYTHRGLIGGAAVGFVSALLNLLILGSKLIRPETGHLLPGAWLWLPGSILLGVILGTLGSALGGLMPSPARRRLAAGGWPAVLAWIACIATLLLITAGGLVTGFRAGLAVPDWPNTYGTNMFLYPLKSMTEVRGAFYEHAHRLMGTLVGLNGLTLAIYLTIIRRDRTLRILVWCVFAAIAFQGVLGGLRVTGRLTTSQTHVAPSPTLAVIHGVFAHAVLGGLAAVAVLSTRRWQQLRSSELKPHHRSSGRNPGARGLEDTTGHDDTPQTDQILTAILVTLVILQTLLGALVRQLNVGLLTHITVAMFVAALALLVGMRCWVLHGQEAILRRLGRALLLILIIQITAGIVALVYRNPASLKVVHEAEARAATMPLTSTTPPVPLVPAYEAVITTIHQANAAALLAVSVMAALWTRRLLKPAASGGVGLPNNQLDCTPLVPVGTQ